jgi:hypothetical protein
MMPALLPIDSGHFRSFKGLVRSSKGLGAEAGIVNWAGSEDF